MKKLILLNYIILWSSLSFCLPEDQFVSIDESWIPSSSRVEIENMPRIRDQDSTPLCVGCAIQTIGQHSYCRVNSIKNCSGVDANNEISFLSVASRCIDDIPRDEYYKMTGSDDPTMFSSDKNHRNLPMNRVLKNGKELGCDTRSMAMRINDARAVNSESCYPFDQFANRFPAPSKTNELMENQNKIQKYYDKYKTEGSICMECFERDVKAFLYPTVGMKAPSSEVLLQALKQDSYNKMWHYLFNQNNCDEKRIKGAYGDLNVYPDLEANNYVNTYSRAIEVIKEAVVKHKRPIAVGICMAVKNGQCVAGHAITISGFDTVCKNTGGRKECREVVKMSPCWGERFFPRNKNGSLNMWYDAKSIFSNIEKAPNSTDFAWFD